ncbi:MAG: HD domain-containing protein [Afipia sp.]
MSLEAQRNTRSQMRTDTFFETCSEPLVELATDIISSTEFERLSRISFLGAIEKLGNADGSRRSAGSRYEHSIGVARIALQLAQSASLSPGELRIALIHGLLHDIGHGPLSHSCEFFFRTKFAWDHHQQLLAIVANKRSSISKVLEKYRLWHDYFGFLIQPDKLPNVQAIFESPINADTIEGILRASRFFGVNSGISEDSLIASLLKRSPSLKELDGFWRLKQTIYNQFIFNDTQARFDVAVCDALFSTQETVQKSEFLLDDDTFIEIYINRITEQLGALSAKNDATPKQRNFDIKDNARPKKMRQLGIRYSERKGRK